MAILNETQSRSARISKTYFGWKGGSTTTGSTISWVDTRSGLSVPDWERRIAQLQSASSDYTRNRVAIATFGKLSALIRFKHSQATNGVAEERIVTTLHNALPVYSAKDLSKVDNIALGNFLTSASDAVSPFKGMVFLGELKETLHMLKRPASALRDGFSTYLKRARQIQRRYGGRLANKALAGLWLENALGWQPLMGSIETAVDAYSAYQAARETYRAYGKGTLDLGGQAETVPTFINGNYFYGLLTTNTTYRGKVVYKGVSKNAIYGVKEETARRVADLSGFRLAEFVPTIWELIPHSFVVDYFTNIGDILNSIHSLANDWVWTSRSQNLQATRRAYLKLDVPRIQDILKTSYVSHNERSVPAEWVRSDYSRTTPSLTLPGLVLELPPLGFQWGTLAALLGARINA